jgi:hypothetical protein
MTTVVAAELLPERCVILAVGRDRRAVSTPVAAESISLDDAAGAAERIRAFRRTHRLPAACRLVIWPRPGDAGVTPVDERPAAEQVAAPSALTIRERAQPLVRAGFRVSTVLLPHHALARLAELSGAPGAAVLAVGSEVGCFSVCPVGGAQRSSTYLSWPAPVPLAPADDDLLARYQLAARQAPHVRQLGRLPERGAGAPADHGKPTPYLACGSRPNLRAAMLPLIEELDQEIDVLDAALAGLEPDAAGGLAVDTAALQVAWAASVAR